MIRESTTTACYSGWLTPGHTAPYVAFCGSTVTVVSELSPDCGQSGRVRRVFWRQGAPWVLICLSRGQLISIPWEWTSLPVLLDDDQTADHIAVLFSPAALLDLVRYLRRREPQRGCHRTD
jgi:hypothetical protein